MRRISSAIAGLAMGAAMMAVPAAPAQAAGCFGSGCLGKDPMVQNCDEDAVTMAAAYAYGQSVGFRLRRSQACGAVWTTIVDNRDANFCDMSLAGRIRTREWDKAAGGYRIVSRVVRQDSSTRCYGKRVWTKMVPSLGVEKQTSGGRVFTTGVTWYWHTAWV